MKAAMIGFIATILAAFIGILPSMGIFDHGDGKGFIPTLPVIIKDSGGGTGGGAGGPVQMPAPQVPLSTRAQIFLSETSIPAGQNVNVSGKGFQANENIVIRVQTYEVGSTEVGDDGAFSNVAVAIPEELSKVAPARFSVTATGQNSVRSATKQITVSG